MMLLGYRSRKGRVTQTDVRTTPHASQFTSVNFGPEFSGRWIGIFLVHEDTTADPGNGSMTIAGVGATRIRQNSTGDGAGKAVGVSFFVAQPTGTSGTVTFNWNGEPCTIIVLSVRGFNLGAAFDDDGSATVNNLTVDIPTNGLLLGIVGHSDVSASMSFTAGLTERGEDDTTDQSRAWGWDFPLPSETGRVVSHSPFGGANGTNSKIVMSFSPT